MDEQSLRILDFQKGSLFFHYDLLGYGMMALSTFFTGLTLEARTKMDKILKYMMLIHGIFFLSCFILPMTGFFSTMSNKGNGMDGVIVLECWCAYFTPVGILSFLHFRRSGI